ncbi:acetyl-CoA hydrolase/transferase family protein [Alicycliphilus denitrificans]|uniref:Acetyl-CoA hydrolase/transferase C-terminal domain-containing protein n=1 Tax=Alicycliphilus denitrificans TaxID=179636 RepID=A0A3R7IES6_9BURK|nr:acetyl-CoA hydrolase/transferase C-terminal domain-containing protein [Alicycliphilus denitrificans]RKJ95135.1 hypothetical protein CE154_018695 [Alicycliphilus denitrificans]
MRTRNPGSNTTRCDPAGLLAHVRPGQSVYVGGGLTPATAFVEALQADMDRSRDLRITTTVPAGFPTAIDFQKLHASATVTVPQAQRAFSHALRDGRLRVLPLTFSGFSRYLEGQTFDLGVFQAAQSPRSPSLQFGPSVEFARAAMQRCRRVAVLVNPLLPAPPLSPGIPPDRIDFISEAPQPLPSLSFSEGDPESDAIGRHLAPYIGDGSLLQMGVGKIPSAIARQLRGHRRLRIHSGLVSDTTMLLAQCGALDEGAVHRTTFAAGTARLYDWIRTDASLRYVGCDEILDGHALASIERLVAINGALEVDLFGQCNLEHASGRAISGAGGAPDFARAAHLSPGGLSVVALKSTIDGGARSRIVPSIGPGSIVSIARTDVDLVVTEHGIADLRGADLHERAKALIGIAAPAFREELERAWGMQARLL